MPPDAKLSGALNLSQESIDCPVFLMFKLFFAAVYLILRQTLAGSPCRRSRSPVKSTPRYARYLGGWVVVFFVLCQFVSQAGATEVQATCPESPEQAAIQFVEWYLSDPMRTSYLLRQSALRKFRGRLEQVLDDRFAPDSSAFRDRVLGKEWTPQRMRGASDAELVGQYLAFGQQGRTSIRISQLTAERAKRSRYAWTDVEVSYRIDGPSESSVQKRTYSAFSADGCWRLDVPLEAWDRLEMIATKLKSSRVEAAIGRRGPSLARLEVVAAGDRTGPGMNQVPKRSPTGRNEMVWVASTPIVTDADIASVSPMWDCDAGLGPEDPAVRVEFNESATAALKTWTEKNLGANLAIVVNGEAMIVARVAGVLGSRITVCLPGSTLDDAHVLAEALAGKAP